MPHSLTQGFVSERKEDRPLKLKQPLVDFFFFFTPSLSVALIAATLADKENRTLQEKAFT